MKTTKYELTDEHRGQLKPWADRWIANALSTQAMDENDRELCRDAVRRLYEAASLVPPPDHRIVFVPSPFVARFAGGFAAWIWWRRKHATHDATHDATDAATAAATHAATHDATYDATDDATWYRCELQSVIDWVRVTAGPEERDWWLCANQVWRLWQGGNQWSAWAAFLGFFRHIVRLPIDYTKYDAWEVLAQHSGPRIVHEKFCIISDRPERLLVDDQSRPHCDDGPFCRWRDGSELFAIHGVRVPAWIVLHPERIDAKAVRSEQNLEVQRVMIERMGVGRYLFECGAKVIDMDSLRLTGSAPRALLEDDLGNKWLVGTDGSTARVYHMSVPSSAQTCAEAHRLISGLDRESRLYAEA